MSEGELSSMPRATLHGLLSYWRAYVPDFASRTTRLRGLLSQDARGWTPHHTAEVRKVLEFIVKGLPILNFDVKAPVALEVHIGPKGMAGVFL